jgi:hypothetical protein
LKGNADSYINNLVVVVVLKWLSTVGHEEFFHIRRARSKVLTRTSTCDASLFNEYSLTTWQTVVLASFQLVNFEVAAPFN